MKNNRWKKALSVALVCCMLAGTGLTSENWGVEFDATLKEGECLYRTRYNQRSEKRHCNHRSSGRSNSENDLVVKETQLHSIISRGFVPTLVIKIKGMEE